MSAIPLASVPRMSDDHRQLSRWLATGQAASPIGEHYVVIARRHIRHGAASIDLTALRFGVSGLVPMPWLALRLRADRHQPTRKWKVWIAVAARAGTPFGLLMFGVLQHAPASHAAVFPLAAMSLMGMILSALLLGDRLSLRKLTGIGAVMGVLVLISGISAASFTANGLIGDAMFILAGTLWAGFGILLRRHRLDSALAAAVMAVSAMVTLVPVSLRVTGGAGLLALDPGVLAVEAVVQGLIAGCGMRFTFARMVGILGPSGTAVFPPLAPGLAALSAWRVLGLIPGSVELIGLTIVIAGLLRAVAGCAR